MTGRVVNYENDYDERVTPKTLHGIKEAKLLLIQCSNADGNTQVLLGLEIEPGDVRTFPEKSWESLGRPSAWLMAQINEQFYGKRSDATSPERPIAKKAAVAPAHPVKMDEAV